MNNLPPGVREADIPGNRPEDVAFDQIIEGPIGEVLANNATLIKQGLEGQIAARIEEVVASITACPICETTTQGSDYCSSQCMEFDRHLDEEEPDWL